VDAELGASVACATSAAFAYALSNVLQQHEAEQLAEEDTLKLGLLARLARRPRWVVGMAADVGGYVFEALALGFGTLVLVEPILSTALLLSLLLGRIITKRQISREGWLAATVLAAGVSLFLYETSPSGGVAVASHRAWLVAAPPLAVVVIACVAAARVTTGARRAAYLGAGAGTLFGVSAVLTKAFVDYLGGGVFNWVDHWEPYALAVSSIIGLVLAQSAFQTGELAAAVSAEQVLQPLVGVVLGVGLLQEHITLRGPVAHLMLGIALAAMVWGVLALARIEHPRDQESPRDLGAGD
jgi:hypothetical protein